MSRAETLPERQPRPGRRPRAGSPSPYAARVQTIVITGGSGRIGGYLRARMRRADRLLRLLDTVEPSDVTDGEEAHTGSVLDRDLLRKACRGADAVVHLAGIPTESRWSEALRVNVDGTQAVLEAAVAAGVERVVLASSNHAAGFWARPADGALLPDTVAPRPDTYYGWTKAAIESLGRLYHDRFGLTVVNLRIGACCDRPVGRLNEQMWLSPDDAARLVEASVDPGVTGFHTVWGMSANTGSWWSREGGRAIGFVPQDDSARFEEEDSPSGDQPDGRMLVGGIFCTAPLGEPIR
jgi:uronate dehydrogenase